MKSLTRSALIVASLAFTGNAALAGTVHANDVVWPDVAYSPITAYGARDQHSRGFFDFPFGGAAHGRASFSSSSPSDDASPPIDDSAQRAQQTIDSVNETLMENSMRATQEQNDEANAAVTASILAAQQTEINANNYANNPNN